MPLTALTIKNLKPKEALYLVSDGDGLHLAVSPAGGTLGPFLQDDDSCLDGFTKADLIGKNDALGKWRPESKQGRIHLVRVQLNARVGDGARQALHAVGSVLQHKLVCPEFALIISRHFK